MEDTQTTSTEPVVTEEPSLDEVISEYNVQPVAQPEPTPQVQPQTTTVNPVTVDPLDSDQFNSFANQISQGQSVLNSQLEEVRTELTNLRQDREQLQVETEINEAVTSINEGLELNPKLVRVHLEYTAQEKPGFKNIWENRHNNPQAFKKALDAVGREMREIYNVKQDPELTSNQVAVQKSQQSLATKTKEGSGNDIEDRLAGAKTQAEFDRIWNESKGGL